MKTLRILLVSVLILGFSQANAQLIKIGLKAGVNFPSLNDTDGTFKFESRNGWHAGASVLINIPIVKVGADVLYSHVGFNVDNTDKMTVDNIDIPIFAKFNFLKIISIHAGPQLTWATAAKLRDVDILGNWEEQNIRFIAGAGLNLGPIDLHGRFIFPSKTQATLNSVTTEIKNSNIQLSLTYYLNHKKG